MQECHVAIGGGVAQILALRHADRVERLGLVNSVCYDSWPIPEMKVLQKTALLADHLPPGLAMEGIEMGLRRGFVRRERADEYLDAFLEPFRTDRGLHVFLRHVGALDPAPTEELAPRLLEAPTA
jgi:pimeloyl-ACP methyl ester carboxylesterase